MENNPTRTSWSGETSSQTFTPSYGSSTPSAPIAQQAREKAGQVIDQARTQVMSQLDSQKERATGTLGTVAQALRQTGQQLRDQNQAPIGQFAERAAEAVERWSGYLNQRDARQMISEAEGFARSQPALFLGGAFALGLLAARFLKSSADADGYAAAERNRFADLQPGAYPRQPSSYVGTQPGSAWATAPSVTPPSASYDAAGAGAGTSAASDTTVASTTTALDDTGVPTAAVTTGMGAGSTVADTEEDEDMVPALGQRSDTRLTNDE